MKKKFTNKNPLKVVLFGPQNTGKTTLAKYLSNYYGTSFSVEYSREFALIHDELNFSTVIPIAKGQQKVEQSLCGSAKSKVVFMDTNLLETIVYSQLYYNNIPQELEQIFCKETYHLYLLCDIDVSWENDGVRDLPENRAEHYQLFKSYLLNYNANFIELKGTKSDKIKLATQKIDDILNNGF